MPEGNSMNGAPRRAVAYYRLFVPRADARQRLRVRGHAARLGLELAAEYSDSWADALALARLLRAARAGEVAVVVVDDESRLGTAESAALRAAGVRVESAAGTR